jgi:hypothetical protein
MGAVVMEVESDVTEAVIELDDLEVDVGVLPEASAATAAA